MRIVFAVTTASVPMSQGGHTLVREGTHWAADDPIVVANPTLFTDDPRPTMDCSSPSVRDRINGAPVEQATANPGQMRGAVKRG